MAGPLYVTDWLPISAGRYATAQQAEREWWLRQDAGALRLLAQHRFYAGYYEWVAHGVLLNPFGVNPDLPQNFQITGEAMVGRTVLDLGCGPTPHTLSLVHRAKVHAIDPLLAFHRKLQPFGWEHFASLAVASGAGIPFPDEHFDFVHCWNVLDHTEAPERVLEEVVRALRPDGQLLLACDARGTQGGARAHPYHWSIETLEAGVFAHFEPLTDVTLVDDATNEPVERNDAEGKLVRWFCRLARREAGRQAVLDVPPTARERKPDAGDGR
jgi:SAM-dependent methyltransferase